MSDDADDTYEAEYFARGDFVRLKLDPDARGQVVNNRNWDREYLVRFKTGAAIWFEDIELESLPEGDDDKPEDMPDANEESANAERAARETNVVAFRRRAA